MKPDPLSANINHEGYFTLFTIDSIVTGTALEAGSATGGSALKSEQGAERVQFSPFTYHHLSLHINNRRIARPTDDQLSRQQIP